MVLEAPWPITVVGLDVTRRARLTQPLLDRLRDSGSPAGRHLHRITDFYLNRAEAVYGRRECAMHDPLALAIAADRSLALRAPNVRVDVELDGSHTRGMTVADLRPDAPPGEANAQVVLEADTGPIGNSVIVRLSPEPPRTILAGALGTSAGLLDVAQVCKVLVETSTLPTVKAILVV